MILYKRGIRFSYDLVKVTVVSLLTVFIMMGTAPSLWSQDEPLPARIRDLQMGASSSSVVEQIKSQGTNALEPLPDQKERQKLTWALTDDPYYENVQFQFTEKDRLYMIRFLLKKELWLKSMNLKKAFFQKFKISPDNPLKMRVKDQEILVYAAGGGDCDFLDLTEVPTGEKWFVLVNKGISGADRAKKSSESKDEQK